MPFSSPVFRLIINYFQELSQIHLHPLSQSCLYENPSHRFKHLLHTENFGFQTNTFICLTAVFPHAPFSSIVKRSAPVVRPPLLQLLLEEHSSDHVLAVNCGNVPAQRSACLHMEKLCEKVPADVPLCFYLENLSKCCHEMSANPKRRSSERSPVFQECKINVCSSACSGFFICLYNLCSEKLPSGAGGCSSSPGFCYEGWRFSESGLHQWLCFLLRWLLCWQRKMQGSAGCMQSRRSLSLLDCVFADKVKEHCSWEGG